MSYYPCDTVPVKITLIGEKMNYEIVTLEKKIVAGVSARTSNNSPDMYSTIGGLWQKLYRGIAQSMKNRANKKAIGLYCDYNEDGTYTVLTGCEVTADPQDGNLDVKTIPAGRYAKFTVKGDVAKAVGDSWSEIWNTPLERTFTGDFEEYQEDCDGKSGTIFIYIAIK